MQSNSPLNSFIKNELNESQRNAVEHIDGPILVIAGAGSGKTRIITARIAHLMLNHNAHHSTIVALTFTNKAAKEMQERISSFLPHDTSVPFVGTFHAYCLQLLKKNHAFLEMPSFSILDTDDQQKLITRILKHSTMQKNITPKQAIYQISHIKNNLIQSSAESLFADHHPQLQELYYTYEQEKKASKCLDFDDLLLEALKLFDKKSFKDEFQSTVRHILVDEYQDTNVVQHELLKKMALSNKVCVAESLCAVGDEDQSIYSWRGATVANMAHFCTDFKKTRIIKVEQNYRSAQPILTAANSIIANNTKRNPKKLWSTKKGSDRIRSLLCISEYQEAESIAQLLKVLAEQKNKPTKLQSVAILYRTHMQSRAIEEACIKHSIPYKMVGGVQFYERKEIKDLLAYLRLVVNPFDRTSFLRVINCPARGLGSAFETLTYNQWMQEPFYNFKELLNKLIEAREIKGVKETSVRQFISCFSGITAQEKASTALTQIIVKTGYISHLKSTYELQEAESRIANVNELVNAIKHMESENSATSIERLLDEIALMQEKASHTNKDTHHEDSLTVTLMTLHAAKGLEFDLVILAGLEDGLLPSTRSFSDDESLEEERRLFYVGITRARERLLISHSRYRYTYGQMSDQIPSRFLQEIPANLMHSFDVRHKDAQVNSFFSEWLGIPTANASSVITFSGGISQPTSLSRIRKKATPSQYTKAVPFKRSISNALPAKTAADSSKPSRYKKNQAVLHSKYGVGLVQKVEEQSSGNIYITAKFKVGIKKVLDTFLQKI